MLSAQDGKELLLLARRSIEERLRRSREHVPPPPGAALQEPAGAFVTIRTHPDGGLRGCIGRLEAEAPAWEMVRAMAVSAAISDPRFRPMGAEELSGVVLKVSILSPMSRVPGPESVVTGKHGVMVRVRGRTGVFLPEVAAEYGWTAEQTLDRLCSEKMFLSADAWRTPGAEIFVFTTQTFEESEPGKTAEG